MNMEEKEGASLADLIDVVRRRGRAIGITFVVALFATCVLALAWPPTFRSTGTILIEQQEIPTDMVRSTVTSYADERVQIISQRVMTTQNLLGIIRRYELYQDLQKRESREKVIERMRDDIRFRMISADVVDPRTGVPRQATIAFSVSYDNPSPDLAVKWNREALVLLGNSGDTPLLADVLRWQGSVSNNRGRTSEAEPLCHRIHCRFTAAETRTCRLTLGKCSSASALVRAQARFRLPRPRRSRSRPRRWDPSSRGRSWARGIR